MNGVLVEFLLTNFRGLMHIILGFAGIYVMMFTMLKARRHVWILAVISLTKAVYAQILVGMLVQNADTLRQLLPLLNAVILPIFEIVLICLFFSEPFYKVIPVVIFTEIITVIMMMLSFLIVNIIEGRGELLLFSGSFMAQDVLIIPIYCLIFSVVYYGIRPLLRKYRNIDFRHPALPLVIFGIYYISVSGTYMMDYWDSSQLDILYYPVFMGWAVFLIFLGYILYIQIRKKTMLERLQLTFHRDLMSAHYTAVRQQDMEEGSRILEQQMEEILSQDPSVISSERIASYLVHLKENRDRVRAGIYCNDWLIDAVLCTQSERIREKGRMLICDTHGYDRGRIDEEDLAEFLFQLLNLFGEELSGDVSLSLTTVRNQLILSLRTPQSSGRRQKKPLTRGIKACLQKYNGFMDTAWHDGIREVTISLQKT